MSLAVSTPSDAETRAKHTDRQATATPSGPRDRLGYRILVTLHEKWSNGNPVRYTSIVPDRDEFELRAAASWLVENGYARWAGAAGISITDLGREAVGSIADLTEPNPQDS